MARAGRAGGATPAIRVLESDGAAFSVLEYRHDPSTPSYGLEAAEALGLDPGRVLKTLVASMTPSDINSGEKLVREFGTK